MNRKEKVLKVLKIVVSILIPIVGIILFFIERKKNKKTAKTYLILTIVGLILNIIATLSIAMIKNPEFFTLKDGYTQTITGEDAISIDGHKVVIHDLRDAETNVENETTEKVKTETKTKKSK